MASHPWKGVSRLQSASQHRDIGFLKPIYRCQGYRLSEASFLSKERDGSECGQPGPLAGISLALCLRLHIASLLSHPCLSHLPTLALVGPVTGELLLSGEL